MPTPHNYVTCVRHALFLTAVAFVPVGLLAQTPPRISVESFLAEADIRSARVSPDGKYLAFLITLGTGKVGIALMNLATGKTEPLVSAKDENIKQYFWKRGQNL